MGRRQKAAKGAKNRKLKRGTRDLKRRTQDQDQAHHAVMAAAAAAAAAEAAGGPPEAAAAAAAAAAGAAADEDLPGGGRFVCFSCGRFFINKETLDKHNKTKGHKKRSKQAAQLPWTQAAAEAAAK